jgi:hypothetical protein
MPDNNNQQEESDNLTQAQREQIIKEGTGYEPSIQVKRTYLFLRKKTRDSWGAVDYPGLFDYNPANDATAFWLAVVLELVGVVIAYILLEERISNAWVLLAIILTPFGGDFMAAYFHHQYKGTECAIQNQQRFFLPEMRVGGDPFPNYMGTLNQKIIDSKERKYLRPFCTIAIWLLAAFKALVFLISVIQSYEFQLAINSNQILYVVILLIIASYIVIAYIHLKFTGYFFASLFHRYKKDSEEAQYHRLGKNNQTIQQRKDKGMEKQYREQRIDLKNTINLLLTDSYKAYFNHLKKSPTDLENYLKKGIEEVQEGGHGIYKSPEENVYIIYRYGLLKDDDLQKMINVQDGFAKDVVAMFGHFLQKESGLFDN